MAESSDKGTCDVEISTKFKSSGRIVPYEVTLDDVMSITPNLSVHLLIEASSFNNDPQTAYYQYQTLPISSLKLQSTSAPQFCIASELRDLSFTDVLGTRSCKGRRENAGNRRFSQGSARWMDVLGMSRWPLLKIPLKRPIRNWTHLINICKVTSRQQAT